MVLVRTFQPEHTTIYAYVLGKVGTCRKSLKTRWRCEKCGCVNPSTATVCTTGKYEQWATELAEENCSELASPEQRICQGTMKDGRPLVHKMRYGDVLQIEKVMKPLGLSSEEKGPLGEYMEVFAPSNPTLITNDPTIT